MTVLAAVMLMILIMALAVPVQISITTRQKIQAQNAADAAAVTGGIWQLRGMNVVQGMNDLVYLLDSVSLACLGVGAVLGPLTAVPVAGKVTAIAGNIVLFTAVGTHFVAQCVVSPFRDALAHGWSILCYVGASASAQANGASHPITGAGKFATGFAAQAALNQVEAGQHEIERAVGDHGLESQGGDALQPVIGAAKQISDPIAKIFQRLSDAIERIPIYAIGFEMNLDMGSGAGADRVMSAIRSATFGGGVVPMWLHVERRQAEEPFLPPLKVPPKMVKGMLLLAKPLLPASGFAKAYFLKARVPTKVQGGLDGVFQTMNDAYIAASRPDKDASGEELTEEGKELSDTADEWDSEVQATGIEEAGELVANMWNHVWYESVKIEEGNERAMTVLPTVTWIVAVSDADADRSWANAWRRAGGLGVPRRIGSGPHGARLEFGDAGAVAMSAAKLSADPVRKVRFSGLNGTVFLVPVKIGEADDSKEYGIFH